MSGQIRDPDQLATLLGRLRSQSHGVRRRRLLSIRQELELDEMYYEDRGSTGGLARVRRCLALVDAALEDTDG